MESYRLVVVSLIALFLFVIISFFLRKSKNYSFQITMLASLLPLISLLRRGVHQSGDFALHIERAVDLWNSLQYGIFPVHWAATLNSTYGYPLFIFIYPLPYYFLAVLKILGISFILSEKILIAGTFISSGIGMYKLTRTFLKPVPSAFSSILYLFAPYHLVDMHFRVAIGELFAYALLPFVFYFTIKLSMKISLWNFFLCAVCYAALILSHPAIAVATTPFIFALPLFIKKANKVRIFLALTTGLFYVSFYWLPALMETASTLQHQFGKSISFENPSLYFISPWRYGFLYQGPTGQISFPMGIIQLLMLIVALVFLMKSQIKKFHKKILIGSLLIFFVLLFLLFPISLPLWKSLPMMTNFQFAYRLMLPISFVLAIIGGISSEYMNRKVIVTFAFFSIVLTILNWGTRGMITDIADEYLIRHVPIATSEGEGLQAAVPKWRDSTNLWFATHPTSPTVVSKGEALIKPTKRTPIVHEYDVRALKESSIRENTLYFPGWNLYVNGKMHQFSVDKGKTGLITFTLPEGIYKVSLKFEDTPVRKLGNIISFFALASTLLYLTYHFVFQRER